MSSSLIGLTLTRHGVGVEGYRYTHPNIPNVYGDKPWLVVYWDTVVGQYASLVEACKALEDRYGFDFFKRSLDECNIDLAMWGYSGGMSVLARLRQ